MNDLDIMGLDADYTYEDLKKAFRRKSKLLHPDKNKDSLKSHLIMIRLNQAYANLFKKVKEKAVTCENTTDKAYYVYKKGMDIFKKIHPSTWISNSKEGLFNAGAIETNPEVTEIIKSLIHKMAEAYFNFSIVVNEYPQSSWSKDSFQKLKDIEIMTIRYAKIVKSYESEYTK